MRQKCVREAEKYSSEYAAVNSNVDKRLGVLPSSRKETKQELRHHTRSFARDVPMIGELSRDEQEVFFATATMLSQYTSNCIRQTYTFSNVCPVQHDIKLQLHKPPSLAPGCDAYLPVNIPPPNGTSPPLMAAEKPLY